MNSVVRGSLVGLFLVAGCGPSLPPTDVKLIQDTQGSLAAMLEGADGGRSMVPTALIKSAYCNTTVVLNDLQKNESDAGIPCLTKEHQ